MSMANSLEARSPFLDYRVVELAATFPTNWKIRNHEGKWILKKAFADELPDEILQPRKRGFSMPLEKWFRNELRDDLKQAVHDPQVKASGIVNMAAIGRIANEHLTAKRDRSHLLWRYLFFVRWLNHRHQTGFSRRGFGPAAMSLPLRSR